MYLGSQKLPIKLFINTTSFQQNSIKIINAPLVHSANELQFSTKSTNASYGLYSQQRDLTKSRRTW